MVWGRRFIVDVLVGASTIAVALAAITTIGDIPYLLLIAGVLGGTGLMLEPKVAAQPAADSDSQSLRPATEPARPEPHGIAHFDAALVDATSV